MAEDNKLVIEAVLDTTQAQRAFADIRKSGQSAASNLQKDFGKQDPLGGLNTALGNAENGFAKFTSLAKKAAIPLAILASTLKIVQETSKLILESERNEQLTNAFNTAAASAGVLGSNLKNALDEARGGVADLEDVLKVATVGANELGKGVEKYPALLNIARQASLQFGGSTIDNFEKINQAIVSGQTRQLKTIGLFIDSKKAVDDFARSIGVSSDQLTEQEKRQALLNATIEKSKTAYQGINADQINLTTSLSRAGIAVDEFFEALGDLLNNQLGPLFITTTNAFSQLVKTATEFLKIDPQSTIKSELEAINKEIGILQNAAQNSKASKEGLLGFIFGGVDDEYVNKRLAELKVVKQRLESEINKKPLEVATQIGGLSDEEQAIRINNLVKFNTKLAEVNKTARDAEFAARLAQAKSEEEIYQIEIERLSIDSATRLQQLDNQLSQLRFISEQEKNQLRLAEVDRFNSEVLKLQANQTNNEVAELKKRQDLVKQINSAIIQSLVNTTSQGLQALGASLVQGGAAFENFGAQVLNILGDLLINVGQAILAAQFAALELFKSLANPANAFFGIASAAALIALGGALKAVSSAKASGVSSPAPAPTFGGGVTDTGGFPAQPTIRDEDRERRTSQDVSVVINGDVLDSDDSGIRIVDLINRAFDKQGVTVRRGIA